MGRATRTQNGTCELSGKIQVKDFEYRQQEEEALKKWHMNSRLDRMKKVVE